MKQPILFTMLSSVTLVKAGTLTTEPISTAADWEIRTALYGWASALDGNVTILGNQAPVDVGFDDVLENLDFAIMGAVEISRGKWSVLADVFFAELSTENQNGNRSFYGELEQFMGNFVISRNLVDDPQTHFDIYAGARVMSLKTELEIETNFIGTFSGSASESWVDPIIGFRFQQELSEHFFFRAVGDIGGFEVSSDLTWQALAGIGYHINESSSVLLGYRGIGTDYEKGDFGYDVISHGVLLGWECKF